MRSFFINKNIKYIIVSKIIYDIENPKKSIKIGAYINKICLYLFYYIKSYIMLQKDIRNVCIMI